MKLNEKLQAMKKAEKEKVKLGKQPYFLKAAAKQEIALEQRYEELKGAGKLQKFLQKRRKKNSNKDHRYLPARRQREGAEEGS
eukprot:gene3301-4086_t